MTVFQPVLPPPPTHTHTLPSFFHAFHFFYPLPLFLTSFLFFQLILLFLVLVFGFSLFLFLCYCVDVFCVCAFSVFRVFIELIPSILAVLLFAIWSMFSEGDFTAEILSLVSVGLVELALYPLHFSPLSFCFSYSAELRHLSHVDKICLVKIAKVVTVEKHE